MASVVEKHPQRATIIEGLLAGRSLRDIAASVSPPVSHVALHRYKLKRIGPAMDGANALSNALKTLAEASGTDAVTLDPKVVTQAALEADPFIAHIHSSRERRERWMSKAEGSDDYRALAALDRNDLSAHELHARLANRLDSSAAGSTTIQIVTPAVTINAGQPVAAEMMTIDIGPER